MRTTLAIDDDVLSIAKEYAGRRNLSLGAAISDLVRLGTEQIPKFELKSGFPQLEYRGKRPLNSDMVKTLLDETE